ncbi:MAG: hypothetical protein ACREMA_20415 [Longimicrobiales bacterium]
MAAVIADPEAEDGELVLTLVGGNVGLAATALIAPGLNLSRGRARLISITGVAGVLTGTGVLLITQPDDADEDMVAGTLIAASAIGLALGTYWTRNYDERQQRPAGPGGDALLDIRNGRWGFNLPDPGLRMLETRVGNRPVYRPAVAVPLLRATF